MTLGYCPGRSAPDRNKALRHQWYREKRPKQPEAVGVAREEIDRVVRAQRFENLDVVKDVIDAKNRQHGKPHKHDRAEEFSDGGGSKLLKKEEGRDDSDDDVHDCIVVLA